MKAHLTGQYLYLLARPPGEEELAELELAALTGLRTEGKPFGLGPRADTARSAYGLACVELIAQGAALADIVRQIAGLAADRFRIEVSKHPRGLDFDGLQAMIALADRIEGRPDLSNPEVRFLLVVTPKGLHFGRLVQEPDRAWQARGQKPHLYSCSIPPRIARAMVNLGGQPGDRLLDPCCGSGAILIEAASMGLETFGCDVSPLWAGRAAENAAHFGRPVRTWAQDARELTGDYDVIVSNLPYSAIAARGANAAETCRQIVTHLTAVAPKLVIAVAHDAGEMLAEAGWRVLGQAEGRRGRLTRRYYVCQRS